VGKGKLLKFSEMKSFSHVLQPGFNQIFDKDFYLKGKWSQSFFGNDNPIVLELGCGKGEYTTGLAEQNPFINYIGVDIKGARIWRGAKTAKDKGLKNVAFIRTSIDHISSFFAEHEISEIWLTFSDPQPKKPKKRLSSSVFLNRYKNFLKHGSIIHLKTDNALLYEYSLALARVNHFKINYSSSNVYEDDMPLVVKQIQTFYEKQFLAEGKNIHYLEFIFPHIEKVVEPEEFNKVESLKFKDI
jgi:tRNA (guanine-N7-)-methyltransferase